MILDIVSIFLDLLPELILGAGPFCVFKGMGTGKDSGKLTFKKIYSDGGLTITEDSTSLDLTSVGGGGSSAIDTCEIAFGTGVGLTSSTFKVSQSDKTIYGLSILADGGGHNYSGVSDNESSIIVGGGDHYIGCKIYNSIIAGGYKNYLYTGLSDGITRIPQCSTAIIGGCKNIIWSVNSNLESNNSSIISSGKSEICGKSSTIITSYDSKIRSYIGSERATLIGVSSNNAAVEGIFNNVSVISSSQMSSIYSSDDLNIGEQVTSIGTNGINLTYGSQLTSLGHLNSIGYSRNSSIISGNINQIRTTQGTILNGYNNRVIEQDNRFGSNDYRLCNNSILNGCYNQICQFDIYGQYGVNNSIIVHGSNNCITSYSSAILNGKYNIIHGPQDNRNNTILNGYKNCIVEYNGHESMIISGKLLTMCARNSIMFSTGNKNDVGKFKWSQQFMIGYQNSMFQMYKEPMFRRNYYYNTKLPKMIGTNTYYNRIAGCRNSTFNSKVNSGTENLGDYLVICTSKNTSNSSIITLGDCSKTHKASGIVGMYAPKISVINGTVSNSSVIGGSNIFYKTGFKSGYLSRTHTTNNSVIIGQKSYLSDVSNSSILGGTENRIEVARNSVIVGGYANVIDGFVNANNNKNSSWLVSNNSVILGGYNNCIMTKDSSSAVIIGGSHSTKCQSVNVPNLDSCDKFSAYSPTGIKCNGISGSKTTLTSITVCRGILVAWAGSP